MNDLLGLFHFFLIILFLFKMLVISLISGVPLAMLQVNGGDSQFY